jgi:hypothetical protein
MWYGPETMADDEKAIAKGYRTGYWLKVMFGGILVGAAYSEELKWVIVAGFIVLVYVCDEIASRLYDLCIRLRRTNELLSKIDIRRT